MTGLIATVFDAVFEDGPEPTTGFIVPDCGGVFAVHERWRRHWRLTHLPTSRAVMPPYRSELTTIEQAVGFARRFYREAVALGVDLKSNDWEAIRRPLFFDLGYSERDAFWGKVL